MRRLVACSFVEFGDQRGEALRLVPADEGLAVVDHHQLGGVDLATEALGQRGEECRVVGSPGDEERELGRGEARGGFVGDPRAKALDHPSGIAAHSTISSQGASPAVDLGGVDLVREASEDERQSPQRAKAQGPAQDVGGYYRPDATLAGAAMRPSETLNAVIDGV